ncbi:unnamed protein product [Thlaspi arvense]|uniref:RNase H type-1 domain-containing protein n=1 Tax=Thlaspi arvense TaxID=13288 RepID=A0AAU9SS86_THLAR|nr:unnamed protein product [Thlaspi arvense]
MGPPTRSNAKLTVKDLLHQDTNSWNLEAIQAHLPHYEETIRLLIPSSRNLLDYQKIKHYLWRALNKALLVGMNLRWRGINTNACCARCGKQENVCHIWFDCPYAKEVWRTTSIVSPLAGLSPDVDPSVLLSSLYKSKNHPSAPLQEVPLFPWILWYLWTSRNKITFEGSDFTASELVTKATQEATLWHSANNSPPQVPSKTRQPEYLPIRNSAAICHTDGAWQANSLIGGMGWTISDPGGSVIAESSAAQRFVSSALVAEAMAVLAALREAISMEISDLHLQSDSVVLVNTLSRGRM